MTEFELVDDAIVRLLCAALLAAVVGIERELDEQPAGLRTHIAVGVGAALFGIVSTLGFTEYEAVRSSTNVQVDVTRVASQVVVGIGFLGAGLIFRRGGDVKNLTTAASLWTVCAVGLTAGVGDIGTAAVAAVLMVIVLGVLAPVRPLLRRRFGRDRREVKVWLTEGTEPDSIFEVARRADDVVIQSQTLGKEDGQVVAYLSLRTEAGGTVEPLIAALVRRDDVTRLEQE